jgi:hypothetical protein
LDAVIADVRNVPITVRGERYPERALELAVTGAFGTVKAEVRAARGEILYPVVTIIRYVYVAIRSKSQAPGKAELPWS